MRGILINPYDQTVTEVSTAGDDPAICKALTSPTHAVSIFTILDVSEHSADDSFFAESLYLDDEGLLFPGRRMWRLKGYPSPLPGCGLIIGTDAEGDSTDTRLSLPEVQRRVAWTDYESSGDMGPGRDATPEEAAKMVPAGLEGTGPWAVYIGGQPVLQPAGTEAAKRAAITGRMGDGADLGD